jgi:hypothetical protein
MRIALSICLLLTACTAEDNANLIVLRGDGATLAGVTDGADAWRAAGFRVGAEAEATGLPYCYAFGVSGCATERCYQPIVVNLVAPDIRDALPVEWHAGPIAVVDIADDLDFEEARAAMSKAVGAILGAPRGGGGVMAEHLCSVYEPGEVELAALAERCEGAQ